MGKETISCGGSGNWKPPAALPPGCGADDARLLHSRDTSVGTFDYGRASIEYAVFRPESYTLSYAYPLIVWFHDDGLNEQDLAGWLPRFSPQNYLGLSLQAPLPAFNDVPGTFRWSTGTEHVQWLEDDLAVALHDISGRLSFHPEKIVTAGIGRGGTMALQMLLRRPEWFAGAVVLNATLADDWRLDWWGQYQSRSVWLGQSECLRAPAGRSALRAARSFHAAGMHVTQRSYDREQWPLDHFAREADWWLMHALCGDTVVT